MNTTGKKSKEMRFSRFIYERKRTGQRDESMNQSNYELQKEGMNEWMNQTINERNKAWMKHRINNEWKEGGMNECMNQSMNEIKKAWMNKLIKPWMEERRHE